MERDGQIDGQTDRIPISVLHVIVLKYDKNAAITGSAIVLQGP